MSSFIRAYFEVTKPRTVMLLSYVGIVAGIIAYMIGGYVALDRLILSSIAIILGCMGTNAITCYIDRDIDAIMDRTKHRPIPRGAIRPPEKALYYGLSLVSIALILTILTGVLWSTLWLLFGVFIVAGVYNAFLKRRNPLNIVIASPGGGAPIMVTWSAVTCEPISLAPLLMAALVVVWTPVHIWSLALKYREDYKKAKVPMLPVVFSERSAIRCIAATSMFLVVFTLLLGQILMKGLTYYVVMIPLNIALLILSFKLLYKPEKAIAWKLFKLTSPYLALSFLMLAVP